MTEQRFDIIVTDKVEGSISTKLAGIAGSADTAATALKALNAELSANGARSAASAINAATAAAAATAKTQVAANSAAAAQANLSAAQDRASASAERLSAAQIKTGLAAEALSTAQARTALAQQRVATEAARTAEAQSRANVAYLAEEAALNRAVAAEEKAVASKARLAAAAEATAKAEANAATAATAAANRPATVIEDRNVVPQARSTGSIASAQAEADAVAAHNAAARAASGAAASEDELTASATKATQAEEQQTVATENLAKAQAAQAEASTGVVRGQQSLGTSAEATGSKLTGLGSKAGMTALSVASALVVAREGSRGDFTRMAGSLSILAMSLDVLAPALAIAAAGFTTLYAARSTFNTQAEQTSLKAYAESLGLTTKELRKLSDTTLDAKGNLKTLDLEQITYADTFNGLVATIENGFKRWKTAGTETASWWSTAFKEAGSVILSVYNVVAAGIIATAKTAKDAATLKGSGNLAGDFVKNAAGAYKDLVASQKEFAKELGDNTDKAARARIKADADAIKGNRNTPKGRKPWDRDNALDNDTQTLQDQIKNTQLYGQALEEANQYEEISKKYREHKAPLNAAEEASLKSLIHTYQDAKRVQQEMGAEYEAVYGPQRKYEDTVAALNQLLDKGVLTQDQYAQRMRLASREYEDATDALAGLNRELSKNGELAKLYGRDRDVAAYIQQLQTAAEAKGQSIYQPSTSKVGANGEVTVTGSRKLTSRAQGMVDEYKRQQTTTEQTQAFQAIDPKQKYQNPNDSSYILDNYKKMYASIQKMRTGDVQAEADANERKRNLDRAYLDAKLTATSTILDNLASLQTSKNRELAAIGKASAIAEATIAGYLAVQRALAGPPGPPWSYAIAASAGVAAAVNVAKIAGVGFQSGGYTGDGAVNQQAGPVHRGEYVFDAAATRRLGVPALDAMRSGAMLSRPAAGAGAGGPRVSIYPQQGVYMQEVTTSDDHIEMIASRVTSREAPRAVAADVRGGSNTHMGKALKGSYGLRRADG